MNKLRILLTWGLIMLATHVMGITITVAPTMIEPGSSAEIIINLTNTETTLTGYQMSLYLPEGVTLQKKANGKYKYTLSNRHEDTHQLTIKDDADGSLLLVCFSVDKDIINGTSGELLRLPIDVASTVTTSLQAELKNIKFSDTAAQGYIADNVLFNLNLPAVPATGISLNSTTLTLTEPGQTFTLTTTITPANSTDKSVTWTSSNTTVATVDNNGVVTAIANGNATITATTNDGSNLSATCNVVVAISNNNIIDFADALVKQICVENWDANADGELSESEAALVSDLGLAFTGNTNITSFDELQYFVGLTTIGESAFSGCSGLTSLMIPNTVTSIGNQAFLRCSSMTNISIPNSVTTIGSDVLNRCSGLTSVTIPSSVTSIGNSLFMYCSNLTTVKVASDNSKYDSRDNCNAIIETSSNKLIAGCKNSFIPNSVTSIGNYAFAGITFFSIYSGGMEIPNSVTSIGNYAFASSGIIWINLPNSINSIGSEAFGGCSSLSAIRIPENVTTIQDRTFLNCTLLSFITIPDGVSSIGYRAFAGCTSLTEITIPSSVTTISGLAFNGCTSLTTVTVKAEAPASINNTSDNNSFPTRADITLFVPIGSKPAYTSTTAWEGFKEIVSIIPFADSEVKQICVKKWDTNGDGELSDNEAAAVTDLGHAFQAKEEITSFDELQYFTGLTSLGDYEFSWSPSLRSVIIPDNVTSLGNAVFDDTGMYTDAPDGVFYVDKWACGYKGDVTPKTISIEEGTRGIANFAFSYFSSLTSVRISNSVEYIGDYSFQECSSMESITLGNSVKTIGNSAFEKCSKLASLSIPNSVTNIGSNAFKGCSRLTELLIPSSVTSIGNCAFAASNFEYSPLTRISVDLDNPVYDSRNDCNAIIETATNALLVGCNSTEVPSSVTSIGDYAFYHCSGLTSVNIPNILTSIGEYAFNNCQSLTGITIPNSVTTIGNSAFSDCYGLTNIIIPNSVTSIGDYTFASCHGLKSLTLGDYVTTIGEGAFQQCSDLSSVTLGNSVLSIGNSAFFWCSNLTSVTAKMQTPVSIHTSVFTNRTNATLYVPYGKKSAYEAAEYWKEFKEIFEIAAKSGDANDDGDVTIADVVAVVNYITTNGNPAGQFIASAADVDGVEGITIADAIAIVNMILSSGSSE